VVEQEVQEPDIEPPAKKKKRKSILTVDPVNGHADTTSDMNGNLTEEPKEVSAACMSSV